MHVPIALLIGILVGFHSATWGMYKDAPHEGFTWPKYLRSPLLGVMVAGAALPLSGLDPRAPPDAVLLFGLVYAVERALVEFYKTFLRSEDQSKYTIPMQLHVGGRIVDDHRKRWLLGACYAGAVLAVVAAIRWAQGRGGLGRWELIAMGSVGGWISAFGGAWKDAPIEGFHTLTFFRSPLIALAWAALLSPFTGSALVLFGAATGFTVATTETYKTFFFPDVPRGKFAGKPVLHPEMLRLRRLAVPLYVGIWVSVLAALVVAFRVSWLAPAAGL